MALVSLTDQKRGVGVVVQQIATVIPALPTS
jgi:hypothetical protein